MQTESITAAPDMLEVDDYSVVYFQSTGVAVTTNARINPGASTPVLRKDGEDGNLGGEIALWGTNNDLPNQIIADVEANPELASTLNWSANALIAGGLVYGYVETDPTTGKQSMKVVEDEAVEAWLEETNIDKYLRHIAKDFYVLNHGFTEMMLNEAGNFVAAIACQDSSYCRFGIQDKKGRIKYGYLCADWSQASSAESDGVTKFPLIDTDYGVQNQLRYGGFKRYLYPTSGTATGRTYYQPAPWHSLRRYWLPLANAIPRFKIALLNNQFAIRYHIEIADWWWEAKYPDWEQKPTLKRGRVEAELKAFDKKMAGPDNAGNSLITMMRTNPTTFEAYSGWKITPLKAEVMDGKLIEDSQEASSHVFFAVGVDPALIGAAPGKSQGSAGSGSDKRVAQNIWTLNSKPVQDIMLEPIRAAFKFNGFGKKAGKSCYNVWFRSYLVQTLDTGNPASTGKTDKNAAPSA